MRSARAQFERLDSPKSVRGIFLGLAAEDATVHKIDGHQSIQAVYGEIAKLLVGNCRWAKDWAVLGARG